VEGDALVVGQVEGRELVVLPVDAVARLLVEGVERFERDRHTDLPQRRLVPLELAPV
jgi:hypothetical protein